MKQAFDIIPLAAAKTKPWINSEQNIHSHTQLVFRPDSGSVISFRHHTAFTARHTISIPQDHNHHTKHHPVKSDTQDTGRSGRSRRRSWLLPHRVGSLPFWSASVLLKFARNWRSQCAMTCDCHCDPWPMGGDEWKGDNTLV